MNFVVWSNRCDLFDLGFNGLLTLGLTKGLMLIAHMSVLIVV
jgi:hypothetical protein